LGEMPKHKREQRNSESKERKCLGKKKRKEKSSSLPGIKPIGLGRRAAGEYSLVFKKASVPR